MNSEEIHSYWWGSGLKLILIFLFLVLGSQAFSQSYNFRNFNSEDGLPEPYVYSMVQDDKGYLWIGTGIGLSKYNGFSFVNYTTNDSLADNSITCSIVRGENLWFGHENGRITFYNGKKFQPVSVRQPDLSKITNFAESPDGSIWASTYSDGLLKLGNDTGAVKYSFINENLLIVTFSFINDSDLLIGTNTGLLYCKIKETGVLELIGPVPEIPESKITCIRKMKSNPGFYVATENEGLFQLNNEQNLISVSRITADQNIDFSGVQDILEDSQADLWVGSFGTGLSKLSHSASGLFTKNNDLNIANGFTTNDVKSIFEDREGTIWSGNYGQGLTQITSKTFSVTSFDKAIYGNDIFSILFTPENKWIGTEKGLIKTDLITGEIVKFYGNSNGFPKDTVTSVYSPDGKVLWIGTNNNGLFRLDNANETIHKYPLAEGSLENSVTVITGKGNQIWVGTKKGLSNINSASGSIARYNINQGGLPHNYINGLYIDRTGKLWVTTRSNTLSYIQGGKVIKIPLNSITRVSTLGPVTEDSDSIIWVGSNGNGVFMIASDSIVNITVKEGLLSNYCYSIISDDQKNIWVGHKGGLSRIRTSDFSVKPVQNIENITDTYQFNPNSVVKDRNGKLLFGSDKGLVTYDPSMEPRRFLPPVLGITSVKINDELIDFTGKIVLSPGSYKIRIDFIGISLKEPTLVTYQYNLEGYDRWSDITKNTSVTYNLTDGEYLFVLNSSSGDGAVSDNPLIINILIKKSIWKIWWFYAIQVLLLMTIVFLYIKRREYRFLAEKKILEEKVRERTYEIQLQKNEIELQRDLIDEKNYSITSSIRYASHIQNSILPPLELINELLPENFILSKPKDIVSGDFYWLAEKDNKIIFTVADCTGHGVPGAFMSFLGITLLNSIVKIQGNTESNIIVNILRERVILSLQQGRKDMPTSDGMDIVLCVLDRQKRKIQYTGGMNNLVYCRDGKVAIIKADRFSVCGENTKLLPFTLNEIDVKEGDVFYLFSDGYKDQFGGEFDKKYLSAHFYLTLQEIHTLPMLQQKEILEKKLIEWMKDSVQTDDITILGIRL